MRKSLLLCTAAAVLFSFSAQASEINPYASVKAVYSWENFKLTSEDSSAELKLKTGGVNAAVGAEIGNVRAELEYGFRPLKQKQLIEEDEVGYTKMGISTYMVNAYYDFRNSSIITPYVGIGVGLADIKLKFEDPADPDFNLSQSKTKFAYNVQAGFGIEVAKDVTIDIGYRYLEANSFKIGEGKIASHTDEVSIGIRYDF